MIETQDSAVASSDLGAEGPDPSWRKLYIAGGVSAVLYVLLALVVPAPMTALMEGFWDALDEGATLLPFIADHKLGWHVVQALTLESSVFAIVTFAALYLALKHLDRAFAAIGAIVTIVAQVLFMAYYPVLLGLAFLSNAYVGATGPQQRELATAAEALVAQNSAFNPIYEPLLGVGVLFFSLAMLKGVFPKTVAYLGIATFVASVVGMFLYPVVGLWYFLWWLFFVAWLIAVGWKLYRLGRQSAPTGPRHAVEPAQ